MRVSRIAATCIVTSLASMAFVLPAALADEATTAPTTAPAAGPADFRKLKAAMPEKLAGLARGETSGQRTKMGEINMAQAEAPYGKDEGDAPKTANVTVIDYGNLDMAKAMAVWMNADLDQESDDQWTKTADLQGRRALMTFSSKDKRGNVQTLAGGRILVTLETNNLDEATFKKAADELPLKALDALATAP